METLKKLCLNSFPSLVSVCQAFSICEPSERESLQSVFLRPQIIHVLKIAYSCPNTILKAPWHIKIISPALHSILFFNTNSVLFAFLSSLMCNTEFDSLIVCCHVQILLLILFDRMYLLAFILAILNLLLHCFTICLKTHAKFAHYKLSSKLNFIQIKNKFHSSVLKA